MLPLSVSQLHYCLGFTFLHGTQQVMFTYRGLAATCEIHMDLWPPGGDGPGSVIAANSGAWGGADTAGGWLSIYLYCSAFQINTKNEC